MTIIKIFLASSEELKHERLVIAEQVANMNRTLANQDITLRLVKWEYLDSSMGAQHKQEDYNDYLVDCDMCFALFWTRFGMYTEIEFEKSLKELNSEGNIRHMSVLFKESTTKSDELRAFEKKCTEEHPTLCHTFEDDETLKELFNAEVERYISENSHLENEDEIESKSSIQTVRIFLSIDKTLEQERLELTDLVENLNHSLESRNANILMLAWDNSANDNNSFNEEMSKTDLCLNLYYTNFNNTTQAELESAYQALCEGKNPKKIYVYFKDGDTVPEKLQEFRDSFPTKYGHFYCSFSNIDTLKADFLLQFMEYQSKNLGGAKMFDINNGKVTIDGKEYVDLKNVPFAGNNEEYNVIKDEIEELKEDLENMSPKSPRYARKAERLLNLREKLSKMENSLWDTALMITRLSTTKCSERLKRAMDLFTAGDNKGAQAVLNEEEIERDVEHNLHLIQLGEEGKKGLKINIEEYQLKIKTIENEMCDNWEITIDNLFSRLIAIAEIYKDKCLYGEIEYEYARFLAEHNQNSPETICKLYKDAIRIFKENNNEREYLKSSHAFALFLTDQKDYEYSLQILIELVHNFKEHKDSATIHTNISSIYRQTGNIGKAFEHLDIAYTLASNCDRKFIGSILLNKAILYNSVEDYESCINTCDSIMSTLIENDSKAEIKVYAKVLRNISLMSLGLFDEPFVTYDNLISEFKQLFNKKRTIELITWFAQCINLYSQNPKIGTRKRIEICNETISFLKELTKRGSNRMKDISDLYYRIACLYYEEDKEKALEYFKKSANMGNDESYAFIGVIHEEYNQFEEAIDNYRIGAEHNDTNAIKYLANSYYNGTMIPQDLKMAYTLYKKGSDNNDAECSFNVAVFYYNGILGIKDKDQALFYFRKAASLGYERAAEILSKLK